MGYQRYFNTKHYTFPELVAHVNEVKSFFTNAKSQCKCGRFELLLTLRPTESSIEYRVKFVAKQNSKIVNVFVINPKIDLEENGKKVPHLYSDGSLCLFYPDYNEWHYTDSWLETLVPWTALWLFYYELWQETGQWLGGGVHGKKHELAPK